MLKVLRKFYSDVSSSKYVLSNFINQELTVKYKRSFLGFFWSLLNPIATMVVSSVVFGSIMRFQLKDFVVFLFAGLLPWGFFGVSVDFCALSIINNEGFIKKIYLPKIVFPLSTVCAQFINMLFSMTALFIIMVFLGAKITPALLFLPVAFLLIFLFTLGMSLILATLNVYFRDMRYLMGVIMSGWYYLTPILYPIEMIPDKLRPFFYWNPVYYLIEMFRAPIYRNTLPSSHDIGLASIIAVITFFLGIYYFYSKENDFVYRL